MISYVFWGYACIVGCLLVLIDIGLCGCCCLRVDCWFGWLVYLLFWLAAGCFVPLLLVGIVIGIVAF